MTDREMTTSELQAAMALGRLTPPANEPTNEEPKLRERQRIAGNGDRNGQGHERRKPVSNSEAQAGAALLNRIGY